MTRSQLDLFALPTAASATAITGAVARHKRARVPKRMPEEHNATKSAQERDKGIERVEAATLDWQEQAVEAVRSLALSNDTLTTDDVWRVLGRDAELEGRAMGAAMRTASKLGYIQRTDRTKKSVRVACHRRDLRVWESLLSTGGTNG